jgi:hypothetical protein
MGLDVIWWSHRGLSLVAHSQIANYNLVIAFLVSTIFLIRVISIFISGNNVIQGTTTLIIPSYSNVHILGYEKNISKI